MREVLSAGKGVVFFLLSLLLTAFPQTEVSAQETKILPENLEMARRMVPQGAVLLRNESDVLPLPHGERVAVFGSGQLAFQPGGGGGVTFCSIHSAIFIDWLPNPTFLP